MAYRSETVEVNIDSCRNSDEGELPNMGKSHSESERSQRATSDRHFDFRLGSFLSLEAMARPGYKPASRHLTFADRSPTLFSRDR